MFDKFNVFKRKIKKTRIVPLTLIKKDNIFNEELCIICYVNFKKQNYISLPCNHIYHEKCILKWLDNKMECPICKMAVQWSFSKNKIPVL